MAVSHGEESVIFGGKKVVTLIKIQAMSNKRQKNFGDKTKNSAEIKAITTHCWQIMKGIQTIKMMIKKAII